MMMLTRRWGTSGINIFPQDISNYFWTHFLEKGQSSGMGRLALPFLGFCRFRLYIYFLALRQITGWRHQAVGVFPSLIMVLFAHSGKNCLLRASIHRAKFLFCSMCNASTSLNSDFSTSFVLTSLPRGTMSTAKTCFLDVLVASRVSALLSLRTM